MPSPSTVDKAAASNGEACAPERDTGSGWRNVSAQGELCCSLGSSAQRPRLTYPGQYASTWGFGWWGCEVREARAVGDLPL